jgi:hypothetical protein
MIKAFLAAFLLTGGMLFAAAPEVTPDPYPASWNGTGQSKTYVLYRTHNVSAMSQGQVGSCVGTATAKALELRTGKAYSAEWCYAISRHHFNVPSWHGGSQCSFAVQAMKDVGPLRARNYAVLGYDLDVYDPAVAKAWQARGPPESLFTFAEKDLVVGFVKITNWEQLRDAIAQRNPVICGSSVGFGKRSGQVRVKGMLYAKWWSRWRHAMCFCGVSDGRSKRALLLNSWGTRWVRGPKWLGDEPDGSFWVTKKTAERMLAAGDAWAMIIE